MDRNFLHEILNTPSPSGEEFTLQRRWREYIGEYADRVEADNVGNVYAYLNPESNFKVLLAAHCDEIGFMVRKIDEKGYLYLEKVGGISPKPALGMKVRIGEIRGVIGVNAEHHGGDKGELTFEKIYVDCGFRDKKHALENVRVGDMGVYDIEAFDLSDKKLASKALDNKSGVFIMTEVLKRLSGENIKVGVVGVSTVNEETNMGGAYFAASRVKPDMAIALDVTFTGDYPESADLDIKLGGGPVLAKGAPINKKILEHLERTAESFKIGVQLELTPKNTGTDGDAIRKTGGGVPIGLISLPLRYMHAPYEVCSIEDIESEIELIAHAILALEENFNLCPLD